MRSNAHPQRLVVAAGGAAQADTGAARGAVPCGPSGDVDDPGLPSVVPAGDLVDPGPPGDPPSPEPSESRDEREEARPGPTA